MPRTVPEWIATHPDQAIPPRVKLRIWEREKGTCHISGRKIRPGDAYDFDHKVALINGGEHRESNLFPALRDKHREKTREDVRQKSEAARVKSKHLGIRKASSFQSRGFPKAEPQRTATRPIIRKSERTPA